MKIKLIHPAPLDDRGGVRRLYKEMMPGLTLPYLAALIGPGHEVKIVKEALQGLDFDEPVDLAAITAFTSRIPRAYQIADEYRRRGVPVAIGGSHVTLMPEEAQAHCDAVVSGESEGLWEELLADAAQKRLKPLYRRDCFPDLKGLPSPRYELEDLSRYLFPVESVQAVRGCPNNCLFCTVTKFYGSSYRFRPVADVLEDIKKVRTVPFFFVDDNIFSNREYFLELLAGMKGLGKYWFAQASLDVADDEDLLRRAVEAGCFALYIGIESLQTKARQKLGKDARALGPADVGRAIGRLHRHRIALLASMMIDPGQDGPESIKETVDVLIRGRVTGLYLFILTPTPQSRLYLRLEKEQGLLSRDWSKYDGTHCLYQPATLSPEQLEDDYWRAQRRFYSIESILRRYLYPPHITLIGHNLINRQAVNAKLHPMLGLEHKNLYASISSVFNRIVGALLVGK